MSREIMQQALDAIRSLMSGRNFGTGQTGHYLNIILRIEAELNRPQPEQEPVCSKDPHLCGFVQCQLGKVCKHTAQPEQAAVLFPSFMRKRVQEAMDNAIHPTGMSVHDFKAKVLLSDLHRMLLVIDSAPPRKEWVGLTSEDWENTPDTGKQGCERDAELFDWIEQTLKDKNDTL